MKGLLLLEPGCSWCCWNLCWVCWTYCVWCWPNAKPIQGTCISVMLAWGGLLPLWANVCSSRQSLLYNLRYLYDTKFGSQIVMTVPLQVQICVCGLLYTIVMRGFSGCVITKVSKKGMDPSVLASSIVNWMCGSILLMCSRNFSLSLLTLSPQRCHPHTSSILLEDAQLCWWPWSQSPPCRGWPLWGWWETPWLLLVVVQRTCLEIGNMVSSDRTPVGWWCALLSWMFWDGDPDLVPIFLWC